MKTVRNALQVKPQSKSRLSVSQQNVSLDDFIVGKSLGQGKFGTAHIAFHKKSGAIFAIKKVKK